MGEQNTHQSTQPASTNPWYALATYYGDPDGPEGQEVVAKNAEVWNSWMSRSFTSAQTEYLRQIGIAHPTIMNDYAALDLDAEIQQRCGIPLPRFKTPADALRIDLSNLRFEKSLDLTGFLFPGSVSFARSNFDGDVCFDDCLFLGNRFDFQNTTVRGYLSIESCKFRSAAVFNNAKLLRASDFSETEFLQGASFVRMVVEGAAYFTNSVFGEAAEFNHAKFEDTCDFSGADFRRFVSFGLAQFHQEFSIIGAKFEGSAFFNNAVFNRVPVTHGASFHQDTAFDDVSWPERSQGRNFAQVEARAWNTLKSRMSQAQRHDLEIEFFAREMRAKAVFSKPSARFSIWTYDWLSDFGRSAFRPFTTFVLLNLLVGLVNLALLVPSGSATSVPISKQVALFTVANSLGAATTILSPRGRQLWQIELTAVGAVGDWPLIIDVLAILQSITGLVLVFLIALAFRNFFRIK